MGVAKQATREFKGDRLSVSMLGVLAGAVLFRDAAMASGSHLLTCATASPFLPTSIGLTVVVQATNQIGTITDYVSHDAVHVSFAAASSFSNSEGCFGFDNKDTLAAASAACIAFGRTMFFPAGQYLSTATFDIDGQLSIAGDDKDNCAATQFIYAGTGIGVHIHGPALNDFIFAVNARYFAVVTYGGASDGVVFENASTCVWDHCTINNAWGGSTNLLRIKNSIISRFRECIITRATGKAIKFESTYPLGQCAHITFSDLHVYEAQTVFCFNGSVTSHIKVETAWVERFGKFCEADMTDGKVLTAMNVLFNGVDMLAGTDNYAVYTDPKVLFLKGVTNADQTLWHSTGIRFLNCRAYYATTAAVNDKSNIFQVDLSGIAGIQKPVTLSIIGFLYSGIVNSLLSAKAAGDTTQLTVYTERLEDEFNSPGTSYRGTWAGGTLYSTGDSITYSGDLWYAIAASTGVTPGSDYGRWSQIGPLSVLDSVNNKAILKEQFWGGDGIRWNDADGVVAERYFQVKTLRPEGGIESALPDDTRVVRIGVDPSANSAFISGNGDIGEIRALVNGSLATVAMNELHTVNAKVTGLTINRPVKSNSLDVLVSAAIDLGTSDVTGNLPAAQVSGLNTVINAAIAAALVNYYDKTDIDTMLAAYATSADVATDISLATGPIISDVSNLSSSKANHGTFSVSGGGGGSVTI